MWIQILGGTNECQNFTDKPIWYAHYDMKPNFDDWSSNKFGGWVKPTLKQFSDREKICGLTEDMNYF